MGKPINPASLPTPTGYSYAMSTEGTHAIYFSGHTAMSAEGEIVGPDDIAKQFEKALLNLSQTANEAEVELDDIVKLTLYATDVDAYQASSKEIGAIYRRFFGDYYPAMTLVEVSRLWDSAGMIEIEAIAVRAADQEGGSP